MNERLLKPEKVPLTTRPLRPDDAAAFQSIRLRGLLECPAAFASSHEEEAHTTIEVVAGRLKPNADGVVLGCFHEGALVGVVGLQREAHHKLAHKALIWGMYVAPEHRLAGVGRALIAAALQHAGTQLGVQVVNLGVNTRNSAAITLYERMGFQVYGTEHDYMRVNGVPQDEHYMGRRLTPT